MTYPEQLFALMIYNDIIEIENNRIRKYKHLYFDDYRNRGKTLFSYHQENTELVQYEWLILEEKEWIRSENLLYDHSR